MQEYCLKITNRLCIVIIVVLFNISFCYAQQLSDKCHLRTSFSNVGSIEVEYFLEI